jgi:DNA-binding GntR family transcriptional regulator
VAGGAGGGGALRDGGGAVTFVRVPQREAAYHAIAGQLLRDELTPGTRVSDTALAAELGIGRTPVREALVQLEREGFLAAEPGRGFFVKPLSARDLREAAPVLCALEALALRESFPLSDAALDALDAVTDQARASLPDPERGVWLNLRWHRLLVEGTPNRRLRAMTAAFGRVLRRHAHVYWRQTGHLRAAVSTQAAVAVALRRRDLPGALALLERGWTEGVAEMCAWLDARATSDAA